MSNNDAVGVNVEIVIDKLERIFESSVSCRAALDYAYLLGYVGAEIFFYYVPCVGYPRLGAEDYYTVYPGVDDKLLYRMDYYRL